MWVEWKKELGNKDKRRACKNLQKLKAYIHFKRKNLLFDEEAEGKNWGSKGAFLWNGEWVRDERGGQTKGKIRRTFNKDSAWWTRRLRIDQKFAIFSKDIKFESIQLRWGVQWIFFKVLVLILQASCFKYN